MKLRREVARSLEKAAPQLSAVRRDLRRIGELRLQLGATGTGARYGVLVDRDLPSLQAVAYLSQTSPEAIGHTYVLSRELAALQDFAANPLDVIANPEDVGRSLSDITAQATALELDFEVVRRATQDADDGEAAELEAVREVLDILGPGVTLLRHVTAGTRSLVAMAEAVETTGFLSADFGVLAGAALEEAKQELVLARQEVSSLQTLLSVQGIRAESFLPSFALPGDSGTTITTTNRVEALLDKAISATDFMGSFMGYDGPRDLPVSWPEPKRNQGHRRFHWHLSPGESRPG